MSYITSLGKASSKFQKVEGSTNVMTNQAEKTFNIISLGSQKMLGMSQFTA
jgi:hypothetical protein